MIKFPYYCDICGTVVQEGESVWIRKEYYMCTDCAQYIRTNILDADIMQYNKTDKCMYKLAVRKRYTRLSKTEKQQICELYREGASIVGISRRIQRPVGSVHNVIVNMFHSMSGAADYLRQV